MKNAKNNLLIFVFTMISFIPPNVLAFNSGSTGLDGAFNPTADTVLQLPENGIFNFTTVDIPAGVTVTFKKNTRNTPVYILATGDVTIGGTVSVNGGDGSVIFPGQGGPGGFDGGYGGSAVVGGDGLGPGGGKGGKIYAQDVNGVLWNTGYGGGGGGYGYKGYKQDDPWDDKENIYGGEGGNTYGTPRLIPIVGGSGGGGGAGVANPSTGVDNGGGGGGGGGAILIASSIKVSITGSITANGGVGNNGSGNHPGAGGGGSGGAIRLIADTVRGNGTIKAEYGIGVYLKSGSGGHGRIKIETNNMEWTGDYYTVMPHYSLSTPSTVFVANTPQLNITDIGGLPVPAIPQGSYGTPDVTLPSGTVNPVTVMISASNIPVGTAITLISTPQSGSSVTATGILSGTLGSSSASISIDLSTEYGCVLAAVTDMFTIQTAMYYEGERIDKAMVASVMGKGTEVIYVTESGKKVRAEQFFVKALTSEMN